MYRYTTWFGGPPGYVEPYLFPFGSSIPTVTLKKSMTSQETAQGWSASTTHLATTGPYLGACTSREARKPLRESRTEAQRGFEVPRWGQGSMKG